MAYATKEDMEKRFDSVELIQISDRAGEGEFNEENFAQAQVDGDADIDVRIQERYTLPLQHVPTILVRLACDLYRYHLYVSLVPEHVEKRYNAAIKVLNEIRDGKINLNPSEDAEPAPAESPFRASAPDRLFSETQMKGY